MVADEYQFPLRCTTGFKVTNGCGLAIVGACSAEVFLNGNGLSQSVSTIRGSPYVRCSRLHVLVDKAASNRYEMPCIPCWCLSVRFDLRISSEAFTTCTPFDILFWNGESLRLCFMCGRIQHQVYFVGSFHWKLGTIGKAAS